MEKWHETELNCKDLLKLQRKRASSIWRSPFLLCAAAHWAVEYEIVYTSPETAGTPFAFWSSVTGNAAGCCFSPGITYNKCKEWVNSCESNLLMFIYCLLQETSSKKCVLQQLSYDQNTHFKKVNNIRECVIPAADSPARCWSVQPDCRPRFFPATVSPAQQHGHFFFLTEVKQQKTKSEFNNRESTMVNLKACFMLLFHK